MKLEIFITLLLHLCYFQSLAEECKFKELQKAQNDVRNNSANWIRYCVAQCLDLTNIKKADVCKYSQVSGLQTGACTSSFQPNPKNDKILLCNAENLNNPYSKFNLAKLIKAGLCTHISPAPFFNYHKNNGSFAVLADLEKLYANDFKIAAEFNTKILLSIGEFHGSTVQTDNFGKIAASEQSRTSFAETMAEFIFKHNLSGIVINWLAPGCIKLNCAAGSQADKFNYIKLLLELRRVLKPEMTIVITLPASRDWFAGYDLEKLFPLVNYFQITTFSYCSHEFPATGHTTPIVKIKSILEFLKKYVSKILIGINGRIEVFKLASKEENKIGAKMISIQGGKTTINQICNRVRSSKPTLLNEIKQTNTTFAKFFCKEEPLNQLSDMVCEVNNNTSEVFVSRESDNGNYAAFDTNWFSFEDKESLSKKVELMNLVGSPGIYLYSVNYDDANNSCGCVGDFAMTRTLAELLRANDGCSLRPCY